MTQQQDEINSYEINLSYTKPLFISAFPKAIFLGKSKKGNDLYILTRFNDSRVAEYFGERYGNEDYQYISDSKEAMILAIKKGFIIDTNFQLCKKKNDILTTIKNSLGYAIDNETILAIGVLIERGLEYAKNELKTRD